MRQIFSVFIVSTMVLLSSSFSGVSLISSANLFPLGTAAKNVSSSALSITSRYQEATDFKIPDDYSDEASHSAMLALTAKTIDPSGNSVPLRKKYLVAIDAGHGGDDPGAYSGQLLEKDIGLDVAKRVNQILKQMGIATYMTRTDDRSVDTRARIDAANSMNASLFISIHSNWYQDASYQGAMTLYMPDSELSKGRLSELDYASMIQSDLSRSLQTRNWGIIDRENLSVLRHAKMPSIIVELGFLSNHTDAQRLSQDSFRQKAAEAMARGIIKSLAAIE